MGPNITAKLQMLGLSQTEAKLYQTGLGIGSSVGVVQLQKNTSLKRPTIYHALDTLASKGLVAKVATTNRQLYSFTPPTQLERIMEAEIVKAQAKLRLAVQLAPALETMQISAGSTVVSHFEDIEGIKAVVDMALYSKNPEWKILAPKHNFFSEFDDRYARYYLNTRKRHNITSKSLWENAPSTRQKLTNTATEDTVAEREPRYLPEAMHGQFTSTMILFDDKVAIISSLKNQSAILITSAELHAFFDTMFEGLWAVSTPKF